MKQEQYLEVFGNIDEEFILAASATISYSSPSESHHKIYWKKWLITAACLCVICCTIIHFASVRFSPEHSTPELHLPLLEVEFAYGEMGYEGFLLYDISESNDNNPWYSGADLKTLPVYKNLAYTDEAGTPVCLTQNEMENYAKQLALSLQEDILEFIPNSSNGNIYQTNAVTENLIITVLGNGSARIEYTPPLTLPDRYSFTAANTSNNEAEKTIHYLLETYHVLHLFETPAISTWGNYSFAGNYARNFSAYEESQDLTESILNYNFNKISFVPNSAGELQYIRLQNALSCAELIDHYPIITEQEALTQLLNGKYFTTVPDDDLPNGNIDKNLVAKTELVYRSGNVCKTFMPFYRFYVELKESESVSLPNGIKSYGIYYVPAVSGQYLK